MFYFLPALLQHFAVSVRKNHVEEEIKAKISEKQKRRYQPPYLKNTSLIILESVEEINKDPLALIIDLLILPGANLLLSTYFTTIIFFSLVNDKKYIPMKTIKVVILVFIIYLVLF